MTVSETLKACAAYKNTFGEFSLDLYFDDLKNLFVAKIYFPGFCKLNNALVTKKLVSIRTINMGDDIKVGDKYFRGYTIEGVAREALEWFFDTESKL